MARAQASAVGELGLEEVLERRERGLWSDAFRRLIRNRLALMALVLLSAVIILAVAGNYVDGVQRYEPEFQDYSVVEVNPSGDHFFGTDNLGRDNWARVLQGLLISLEVGFGVQIFVLTIGLLVGGAAALGGRLMDNLMMRITDVAYAFPDLLPIIGGRTQDIMLMIFAIGFVAWVTVARLVRGQMLSLKERDFVTAARAMGATPLQIVYKHMLPN